MTTTTDHAREIAAVAKLRHRHDAKAEMAPDDATVAALGRELRSLDRRMTTAASALLRKPALTASDVRALARTLRHFSEDTDDGLALDDQPIVEKVLARLLGHLCGEVTRAAGGSDV